MMATGLFFLSKKFTGKDRGAPWRSWATAWLATSHAESGTCWPRGLRLPVSAERCGR